MFVASTSISINHNHVFFPPSHFVKEEKKRARLNISSHRTGAMIPWFHGKHKIKALSEHSGPRLFILTLAFASPQVEREARPVTVYSLRQVDPSLPFPRLGLEICSGGGFYVRTVIEDLARVLETRGHMTALERTKQVCGCVLDCQILQYAICLDFIKLPYLSKCYFLR